jgi:hypothetical protein
MYDLCQLLVPTLLTPDTSKKNKGHNVMACHQLGLKNVLKLERFTSAEEITSKVTRAPTEVSKNGFQGCFQKLYEH